MVDKMENDLRKFVWLKGVRVGCRNGEIEGGWMCGWVDR